MLLIYKIGTHVFKKTEIKRFKRDLVMNNLNRLKGTEEELGKLNVKEDYTKEREQIKNFST